MATNTDSSAFDTKPATSPRIIDLSFTSAKPLPANYTREIDHSGRTYYINQDDNCTSWHHPAANKPHQDPRLPKHIERRVDVKGRSFYWNHETKGSSWLNPLKMEEIFGGETTCKSVHERTEDGERDYWVDYTTGTVTRPRKLETGVSKIEGKQFPFEGRMTGSVKL